MHFNLNLDSASHLSSDLVILALFAGLLAGLFWFFVLASALSRQDLEPVTKLMWVFVIVATPVLGALLYLFIAPRAPDAEGSYMGAASTCAACRATIPAGSSVCPKCGWTYDIAKS
jgi:hypothetical protein